MHSHTHTYKSIQISFRKRSLWKIDVVLGFDFEWWWWTWVVQETKRGDKLWYRLAGGYTKNRPGGVKGVKGNVRNVQEFVENEREAGGSREDDSRWMASDENCSQVGWIFTDRQPSNDATILVQTEIYIKLTIPYAESIIHLDIRSMNKKVFGRSALGRRGQTKWMREGKWEKSREGAKCWSLKE